MTHDNRTSMVNTNEIVGFRVVASDGSVGRVHRATLETPLSHLVVEAGTIFHRRPHLISARFIGKVNYDEKTVTIRMTKRELRQVPEYQSQDSFELAVAHEEERDERMVA